MKLAIVGNSDESLGFSLAGATPYKVENDKEFIETVKMLLNDKEIGLIIVVDRFFDLFSKKFADAMKKSAIPAIVFIPSIDGIKVKRDLKGFLANVLGIKL